MPRFCAILIANLLLLFTTACSSMADEAPTPACASDFSVTLIAQLSGQPKQNPAAEITQYTYEGQTVYLVTGGNATATTKLNYLFDACGTVLCAASGGPSGQGDGRCPSFQAGATNPVLIWRDPR
jgi:hypothetical protein